MTGYPLASLTRVRQLREDAASAECTSSEKILLAARRETLARQKALDDYLVWRKQEEDRRYHEILGKELSFKELEDFKAGLAALRDRDNILLAALEEARKAEEEAAQRRDAAVESLKQARKEKEKISENRKVWQAAERKEAERREDLEMEEFTGVKRPDQREDSDD